MAFFQPIGGLYATYHPLKEPEKSIDELGGFSPYFLGGLFTLGLVITGTMILNMFFAPVLKFNPYCYGTHKVYIPSWNVQMQHHGSKPFRTIK